MGEPNTLETETYNQNVLIYFKNGVFNNDLYVPTEKERVNAKKVIFSIIIVCFSIFFFGLCVSSSDFFIANFNERLMINNNLNYMDKQMINTTDESMDSKMMNTTHRVMNKQNVSYMNGYVENYTSIETTSTLTTNEESWFISIILLGAFFGNIVISNFHLNRKLVIMINNFVYIFGIIVMFYSTHVAPLIIGKFIFGVASGISFAYVSAYLTELKIHKNSGFIGSFQSMVVTLGVICGYLFELCFYDQRFLVFFVICIFILAHSVYLIFILNTKSIKNGKNIKSLFENRESWKLVIMCCTFHLTQQASGVDVVLICASILLKNTNASKNTPVFVGLSQFFATLVAMSFVDKFGRKPLLIISVAGVIISLSIITFSYFIEIGMYVFMICFSLGLGPITWFITGEVVPLEYRDATNQIAVSINWISSFIAVLTQGPLFTALGTYMFMIYMSLMFFYLIYLIVFFTETKGRIPSFL